MYQVLYRKYRPQTFSDVVGQAHITETLSGAVASGRLSHAYLFTGSRGTGKTSCAKILAKAVNCERPVDGNPCNECDACRGIDNGSVMDVIEIDAASNNGVDNIRDLREEANYTPSCVKYRVYIIDEVHMLSVGAFNALLKTLEEPPEHVKFILATTEVHKLPTTILSRCQRFDFKRIAPQHIAERLALVSEKESIRITDGAATLIARIADGALRDALSLLDRCASYGTEITEQVVSDAAGIAGHEHIFALTDAIAAHDCPGALALIHDLYNNSCDMERLLDELIAHFRNIMIALTVPNFREIIVCPESETALLLAQGKSLTLETVLCAIDRLNDAVAALKKGADRRTTAEMAVIRLANPKLDTDADSILRRISELEVKLKGQKSPSVHTAEPALENELKQTDTALKRQLASDTPVAQQPEAPAVQQAVSETPPLPPPPEEPPSAAVTAADIPTPVQAQADTAADKQFMQWAEVIEKLNETSKPLVGFLVNSTAFIHSGGYLLIRSENKALGSILAAGDYAAQIAKAVFEITGTKYRLGIYNDAPQNTAKKDPLEGLLDRAKGLGMQVNLMDQQ